MTIRYKNYNLPNLHFVHKNSLRTFEMVKKNLKIKKTKDEI